MNEAKSSKMELTNVERLSPLVIWEPWSRPVWSQYTEAILGAYEANSFLDAWINMFLFFFKSFSPETIILNRG